MKLPTQIICATGEVTIAIARYLEVNHGVTLDGNLLRRGQNPINDYFFTEGQENIISVRDGHAYWKSSRDSTGKGFKTLREFVESIQPPSWKIGCRTVSVAKDGLFLEEDNITIPKKTVEEMLAAIK